MNFHFIVQLLIGQATVMLPVQQRLELLLLFAPDKLVMTVKSVLKFCQISYNRKFFEMRPKLKRPWQFEVRHFENETLMLDTITMMYVTYSMFNSEGEWHL